MLKIIKNDFKCGAFIVMWKVEELSEKYLKEAFAMMPGGFFVYAADEREEILYANECVLDLFGCTSVEQFQEMTGGSFSGLVYSEDYEEIKESIDRQISTSEAIYGKAFDQVQYRIKKADGSIAWIQDYGHKVYSVNNGWVYFVFIVDITEQKRLEIMLNKEYERQKEYEEALERAYGNAMSANNAKTLFLENMSHNMRTPLYGIMGMTDIAKKSVDDPVKISKYLDNITKVSKQLLSLINDLLDMSCIEDKEVTIDREHMDMSELLDEIIALISEQAYEKQIEFVCDIKQLSNTSVIGDRLHLQQILINVLGNAVKYTKPGGRVEFSLRELEQKNGCCTYLFKIKDNGIGMSENFAKYIFEPFSKEDSKIITEYQGTGLGMSIAKRLTQLMGGEISFDTQLNKGTTFYVSIPLEIDETGRKNINSKDINLEGMRVLLVEDNEINSEIAKCQLESKGVFVDCAENGQIALDMFNASQNCEYDAILMDIMMPVMDGLEATKNIRDLDTEYAKNIPIIALTANAFDEDKRNCLAAGMNMYLSKPVDMERLFMALSQYK